ncbi:MAG: hypothetical protein ACREPR_03155 [Brasilonema sp.]
MSYRLHEQTKIKLLGMQIVTKPIYNIPDYVHKMLKKSIKEGKNHLSEVRSAPLAYASQLESEWLSNKE